MNNETTRVYTVSQHRRPRLESTPWISRILQWNRIISRRAL